MKALLVVWVLAIAGFIAGCVGLAQPRDTVMDTADTQIGAPSGTQLETIGELEAMGYSIVKGAADTVKETQWYKTGEAVAGGLAAILGALGVGGFVRERSKRKQSDAAAQESSKKERAANDENFTLSQGIAIIEDAIRKAKADDEQSGKVVTKLIAENGYDAALVDKARRIAHDND